MNSVPSAYSLPRPPGGGGQSGGAGSSYGGGGGGPPVPVIGPPNSSPSMSRMSQIPQGSKLATYMKATGTAGGYGSSGMPPTHLPPPTMDSQLKKLTISGIQEFVPSSGGGSGRNESGGSGGGQFSSAGSFRASASPRASPTPAVLGQDLNGGSSQATATTTSTAASQDPSSAAAAAAAAAAAINTYNEGGTMYFYQGDDMVRLVLFLSTLTG